MSTIDIIAEIIAGKHQKENPVDLIALCTIATNAALSKREYWRRFDFYITANNLAERYVNGLRHFGKILCPIYDIVKPDSYVAGMTKTRLQYRGIAGADNIQMDFLDKLYPLIEDETIYSIERCMEYEIWKKLSREQRRRR